MPAKNQALISLGSNINPIKNLRAAVGELAKHGNLRRISQVWQSPPAGFLDQADFLNVAVLLETHLSAEEIKPRLLRPIELLLHRVRDPRNINAPRTIDLDLSVFITARQSLVLDADILTRAFVAIPLSEIAPEFVHPETGQTLAEIAGGFDAGSLGMLVRPDSELSPLIRGRL